MTWRLAACYADELNVVYVTPEEVAAAMPIIRSRCEENGRDPGSLKVSLYCRDEDVQEPGQARVDFLGRCAQVGLSRLVAFPTRWGPTVETQARFAEDCRAAGIELESRAAELELAAEPAI